MDKKLIIFGVGEYGKRYYSQVRFERDVVAFAVSKKENNPDEYLDIPVKIIAELADNSDYLISTEIAVALDPKSRAEVVIMLHDMGFKHITSPKIIDKDYYYNKLVKDIDLKNEITDWAERVFGRAFDIDHPKTFDEKIQWLKVYDTTPLKTKLTDKLLVREYIKEKLGGKYLIPLISSWDSPYKIDFGELPSQYVLKCNHGCGFNIVVKDNKSADRIEIVRKLDTWMNTDFSRVWGFELQYGNIERRIVAEEYIEQLDGGLLDYKIHCFNGRPDFIQIIGDRDLIKHTAKQVFVDIDYKKLDFTEGTYPLYDTCPSKPENWEEMMQIAEILAGDFIYVRVDLYSIKGRVLFGEMTFTPAGGYHPNWDPRETDKLWGKKIKIKNGK